MCMSISKCDSLTRLRVFPGLEYTRYTQRIGGRMATSPKFVKK